MLMKWALVMMALDGNGHLVENVTRFTSGTTYETREMCEETQTATFYRRNPELSHPVMCLELDRPKGDTAQWLLSILPPSYVIEGESVWRWMSGKVYETREMCESTHVFAYGKDNLAPTICLKLD